MASGIVEIEQGEGEDLDRICRFCHTEEYPESGGELIAPCLCKGTQRYVHQYCLQVWQQHNVDSGNMRKARYCDVCSSEYIGIVDGLKSGLLAERPGSPVFSFSRRPLAQLVFQLWQGFAICNGAVGAIRLGWVGFRTGQSFGLSPTIQILKLVMVRTTQIQPTPLRWAVWAVILKTSSTWVRPIAQLWRDACYLSVCLAAAASAYGLCTNYVRTIKWTLTGTAAVSSKTAFGLVRAVVKALGRFAGLFRRAACMVVLR
jgi:hypothetical protein